MTSELGGRRDVLLYCLMFFLYVVVLANFYFTFVLNQQAKSVKFDCEKAYILSDKLSKVYLEEKSSRQYRKPKTSFNKSDVQEVKRDLSSEKLESEKNIVLNVTSKFENIFPLYDISPQASILSRSRRSTRHRKRLKVRDAAKPQRDLDDNSGPSVEFFPKPQPTLETQGYIWLTSYSRIPVSLSCKMILSVFITNFYKSIVNHNALVITFKTCLMNFNQAKLIKNIIINLHR